MSKMSNFQRGLVSIYSSKSVQSVTIVVLFLHLVDVTRQCDESVWQCRKQRTEVKHRGRLGSQYIHHVAPGTRPSPPQPHPLLNNSLATTLQSTLHLAVLSGLADSQQYI